jgi:hypothetical protein
MDLSREVFAWVASITSHDMMRLACEVAALSILAAKMQKSLAASEERQWVCE